MDFAGIVLMGIGVWLVTSAVSNRAPIGTILAMLRNPSNASGELAKANGTWAVTHLTGGTLTPTGSSRILSDDAARNAAVAFARSKIGMMYQYGGTGNPSYDCSGLVQAAWASAGYTIARTTFEQLVDPRLKAVTGPSLFAGDLIFPNTGHVQMYTGNGTIVEAARTGIPIREMPYKAAVGQMVRRVTLKSAAAPDTHDSTVAR